MNEPSELNAGFQQWLTRYEEPVPDRIPLPYSSLFSGLKRARCEDWVISMPEPRPITQSEPSDQQCTDSPMSETMHEEPDRQSEKRLRLCLERIGNLQTEDIMHRENPDATKSTQLGSTIPIMDIDDLLVQSQSCVTHNPQQDDKSDRNIFAYYMYPTNGSETSGEDSPVAKSRHRSMSVFPKEVSVVIIQLKPLRVIILALLLIEALLKAVSVAMNSKASRLALMKNLQVKCLMIFQVKIFPRRCLLGPLCIARNTSHQSIRYLMCC